MQDQKKRQTTGVCEVVSPATKLRELAAPVGHGFGETDRPKRWQHKTHEEPRESKNAEKPKKAKTKNKKNFVGGGFGLANFERPTP